MLGGGGFGAEKAQCALCSSPLSFGSHGRCYRLPSVMDKKAGKVPGQLLGVRPLPDLKSMALTAMLHLSVRAFPSSCNPDLWLRHGTAWLLACVMMGKPMVGQVLQRTQVWARIGHPRSPPGLPWLSSALVPGGTAASGKSATGIQPTTPSVPEARGPPSCVPHQVS